MEFIAHIFILILVLLMIGAALFFGMTLIIIIVGLSLFVTLVFYLRSAWTRWRFLRGAEPDMTHSKIIEVDYKEIHKHD